jgi:hypothetical protein
MHTNLLLNTDKNQKTILTKIQKVHDFKIGDKVLISNDFYNGKNPKLALQFKGPGEIINNNDINAKVKLNNKIKVNKLKLFLHESNGEIDTNLQELNFNDFSSETRSR